MKKLIVLTMLMAGVASAQNAVSYKQLEKAAERMTEAQFKHHIKRYKGKTVLWVGWVVDVEKNWFGDKYQVQIDMDGPEKSEFGMMTDVTFDLSERTALRLRKKAKIKFKGKIHHIFLLLGTVNVSLKHGKISRRSLR